MSNLTHEGFHLSDKFETNQPEKSNKHIFEFNCHCCKSILIVVTLQSVIGWKVTEIVESQTEVGSNELTHSRWPSEHMSIPVLYYCKHSLS